MTVTRLPARMQRLFHRLCVPAGVFFLSLVAMTVQAANFSVTPVIADIPASTNIAVFEVENRNTAPLSIQIDAYAWSQAGEEFRHEAEDLIVVPPMANIRPGGRQMIRIALRDGDRSRERAFRVVIGELPGTSPAVGGTAVATLLTLDVPLFFAPRDAGAVSRVVWAARRNQDGTLTLKATNHGQRYARFVPLNVEMRERRFTVSQGPVYVLAGASRDWTIPAPSAGSIQKGDTLTVTHLVAGQETSITLAVE